MEAGRSYTPLEEERFETGSNHVQTDRTFAGDLQDCGDIHILANEETHPGDVCAARFRTWFTTQTLHENSDPPANKPSRNSKGSRGNGICICRLQRGI